MKQPMTLTYAIRYQQAVDRWFLPRCRLIGALVFFLVILYSPSADAQTAGVPIPEDRMRMDPQIEQGIRPTPERPGGDKRQEFPEVPLERPTPVPQLTPPPPPAPEDRRLSTQLQVDVKAIKLTGNTVFTNEDLAEVVGPYEKRTLTSEDLQSLRQALTIYYVNKGYINSGAVIPDQEVKDGVIEIRIVEGELTDVELSGNEWLRDSYIEKRLRLGSEDALNLQTLQERMQLLHQDRRIERINAELQPGLKPGEGVLNAQIEESRPYELGMSFNNRRSTSVGELRGEFYGAHYNLTGFGDVLTARYGITDGVDDIAASYSFPLSARDTRLNLYFNRTDADIVEEPFDFLGINSETMSYGFSISHPFYRTPRRQFIGELIFERRHTESSSPLLGNAIFVQTTDGESDVSVIRLRQEWVDRGPNQVLALRSTFSQGIDVLGATPNQVTSEGRRLPADGKFFSWLGQFQWVRRLWDTDNQVLVRGDVQLTPDALLSLEKLGVGGATTVRGYRENLLVRDQGFIGSIEFRFPVFRLPLPLISEGSGDGQVQFATFYDLGWSENVDELSPVPRTISSSGIGLRWDPHRKIHSELYWGIPLRDVETGGEDGLQDSGIHFLLDVNLL